MTVLATDRKLNTRAETAPPPPPNRVAAVAHRVRRLPRRRTPGGALPGVVMTPVTRRPALAMLVLAAVLGVLFYVAQSAGATQASYEIHALQGERQRLLAEQEQLTLQLARTASVNQVDAAAGALGLSHPRQWEPVAAVPAAIALAPEQGQTASAAASSGLLSILADLVGRPTYAAASGR
jgi:hypothetical protein